MSEFSWDNFDEEFIKSIIYNKNTKKELQPKRKNIEKEMLIPSMELIAPYPTKDFVVKYREEIETKLLRKYPEYVEKIYKHQLFTKASNHLGMLTELSRKELSTTMVNSYMTALSEIGTGVSLFEAQSRFAHPVTINLKNSIANEIPLYDFQEEAVQKLKDSFISNDNSSGMLVMPTGSGKTRTSTYFLLKYMISKGYQVIWLTHRHMLIDQAAEAFYNFSPLIKLENPSVNSFKIACVSGNHSSIKATEKDDDIMIISVQSGFRNLDYFKKVLAKKVIIVVDEAHHTVAMSYRKIIDYIRNIRKKAKLLGLTATPIRGNDSESKYLLKLFENNIIYDISMSELITKEILATPNFERIETNTNFESIISLDESELIRKYGEIPATLANKIAQSTKRNKVIIDTYMENKDRYGKTLIFALNSFHCYTLCDELQKRGIRCDYIYSGNNDNELKIRRFKEDELDVLVNINILTEGSDVPNIQTVFLTRPTQSEGLLMQMIGRGLRGKLAGGTENAIIVDFCDKWDTFNKWLNPEWLMDVVDIPVDDVVKDNKPKETVLIPWDLIKEIYYGISFIGDSSKTSTMALPAGWFSLMDEEGFDYKMLVFEDQLNGFNNLQRDEEEILKNQELGFNDVLRKYFGGFEMPPQKKDMSLFMENWFEENKFPHLFTFEGRKNIDPVIIASRLKEENIGLADIDDKIREIYNANSKIIDNIYGDYQSYNYRIMDCIKYSDGVIPTITEIEEMPLELIPFKLEDTYNLNELAREVVEEMFAGEYQGIESIEWTDKPYRSYYGKFYDGGIIRINSLLNSPDVPRETVKFLIYHEMLHRDYKRHDKAFYKEEHKYPDYTEHNRFLDYKLSEFKFEF